MAGPPGTRSNLGDARSSGKWVEVPAKLRGSSSKLTVACETHVGFGLAFDQARTTVLWTCVITVGVVLIVFDWIDSSSWYGEFSGEHAAPLWTWESFSTARVDSSHAICGVPCLLLFIFTLKRIMTLVRSSFNAEC